MEVGCKITFERNKTLRQLTQNKVESPVISGAEVRDAITKGFVTRG